MRFCSALFLSFLRKGEDMTKYWNRIKAFFSKPANIILVIFAVLLALLTLYPLIELVRHTFVIHATDATIFPGTRKECFDENGHPKYELMESNNPW